MHKSLLLVLGGLLGGSLAAHATTVGVGAGPGALSVVDASLNPDSTSSLVWVGAFAGPGSFTFNSTLSIAGNVANIEVAGGWDQFGLNPSTGVSEGTGALDITTVFSNSTVGGSITDNVTGSPTASADFFNGQQIYLWIFNGPTVASSTEMGIFEGTNSTTPWLFPINQGGVGDAVTLSLASPTTMTAVGGAGSVSASQLILSFPSSSYTYINALGPNVIADGTTTDVFIKNKGTSGPVSIGAAITNINSLTQGSTTASTIDTSPGTLRLGVNGSIFINAGSAALTIGKAVNSGILTAGGNTANVAGGLLLENNSSKLLTINSAVTDNGTGAVSVTVAGPGTTVFAGINTYSGATTVSTGTLQLGTTAAASQISTGSAVSVTAGGTLSVINVGGNALANNIENGTSGVGTLNINSTKTNTLSGMLTDGADGQLALTQSGTGITILTNSSNGYSGTTTITKGTLQVGSGGTAGQLGVGNVVDGGILAFNLSSSPTVADAITGTGILNQNGAGTTLLTATDTYSGATHLNAGTLQVGNGTAGNLTASSQITVAGIGTLITDLADGSTFAPTINLSAAGATLNAIQGGANTLSGVISGTGVFNQNGTGTTTLTGADTYTGATNVNAGTLAVNGSLSGSAVSVKSAATLSGAGNLTGAVSVLSGGDLNPGGASAPGTLTVGSLVLNASANSTFRLVGPGVIGGGVNDLVSVTGNLTIAGTLNVTPLTGFGIGTYTLFTYGGKLSNNGFSLIDGLAGYTTSISTGVTHDVDLVVALGTAQYWDGAVTTGNNHIAGGSGAWNNSTTNWTNASGAANLAWLGGTAVFATPGGTVTLGAPIGAQGLIFGSGGYTISGTASNTLTLSGSAPTISVTSAGTSVTISAPLAGTAGLTANGAGTLILTNASNGYTGATTIRDGIVQIGTTATAGSLGGGTVGVSNGGRLTLVNVSGNAPANNISNGVGGVGTVNISSAGTNTLSGTLTDGASGQLALTQSGAGITILTNSSNSYTGATTVSAGTLQIGNGGTGNLAAGTTVTVSGTGILATNLVDGSTFAPNVNLNATGATLKAIQTGTNTLSGAISGSGVFDQNGTGTTILNNAETYTGATKVNAGTLQVGDGTMPTSLATSSVTVAGSSTLVTDLPDGATLNQSVNLSGKSTTLNAIQTGTNTLSGVISGSGVFDQNGSGTTILSSAETYTGVTNVNAGTLQIGSGTAGNLAATAGAVTVSGSGTLATNLAGGATFSRGVTLGATGTTFEAIQSGTNTVSGVIGGSGAFDQSGTGTTVLTNTETYVGVTNVNAGTLQIGNGTAGNLAAATVVTVSGTGSLATKLAAGSTFAPSVDLSAAGTALKAIQTGANTLSGVISGSGAFDQNGTGTTILNNTEIYTGATKVGAGTLQIGNGITGNLAAATAVTVSGTGSLATDLADGSTFASTVDLSTTGTALKAIQTGTNTLSGAISGSGVFDQNGTGTTILNNAETYTGATKVNAGTLQVGDGTTPTSLATSSVTVAGSSTLVTDLPDGATLNRSVNLSAAGTVLKATQSGTNTISGVISGTGAFNQNGSGTTILTNANAYTGATVINNGTLLVNNTKGSGTGTGNVTVNSSGVLGGSGTISKAVTLNSGGTIAPRAESGAAGVKLHAASLTWNGGGTLLLQLGAGPSSDELALTGALKKGSTGAYTLDIIGTGIAGDAYTLATFASTTFAQANFTMELPSGYVGTLVETSTSLSLDLTTVPAVVANTGDALPLTNDSIDAETTTVDGGIFDASNTNSTLGTDNATDANLITADSSIVQNIPGSNAVDLPPPVPEPGSGALLALAAGLLLGWRRRQSP